MSLTTEIEELLKQRTQLQKILQSINQEENYLGKRLRIVEEKLAVQELEEKVKAKRAVVEQLKSKIIEQEKRWNGRVVEVIAKISPHENQQPKQPEHSHLQRVG